MMQTLHFIAKGVRVSQEFQSSLPERNIFSAPTFWQPAKNWTECQFFACVTNHKQQAFFLKERLQYYSLCNVSASASSKLHKLWFLTSATERKNRLARNLTMLRSNKGLVVPQSAFVHNQWRIWELSWKQGSVPKFSAGRYKILSNLLSLCLSTPLAGEWTLSCIWPFPTAAAGSVTAPSENTQKKQPH